MHASQDQLLQLLNKHFGFTHFRKGQVEVINSILEKRDTLAVMPTGGGKSLCFQLPALLMEGTAVVVSPLIALMKDQVDALSQNNIPATSINSSIPFSEISERLMLARNGQYKLIYVAPERLESRQFIGLLKTLDLSFLTIDEAHCISEWGHDFRPAYLSITKVFDVFESLPVLALTATATPDVQDDIIISLKMKSPNKFIRGFDRPNLNYLTEYSVDKISRVVEICQSTKTGSTIVYCGSRKKVEEYTLALQKKRIKAIGYHAGMQDTIRKFSQDKFINDDSKIIVATNAFGMGIDKPDVRNVIHCDLTSSLESYYQEAGRAGRDGASSNCTMLYNHSDRRLQEFFINCGYPEIDVIQEVYDYLYNLSNCPLGRRNEQSILQDESQIANELELNRTTVEAVLTLFAKYGLIRKGYSSPAAGLRITTSRQRLKEYYQNTNDERKKVLDAFLRSITSKAYREEEEIDFMGVVKKYSLRIEEVEKAIIAFEFAQILSFRNANSEPGFRLLLERMPLKQTPIDFQAYLERRKRAFKKLDLMEDYAMTFDCKRNFILKYFRDTEYTGTCGRCSSCKNSTKKSSGKINKLTEKPHEYSKYVEKIKEKPEIIINNRELYDQLSALRARLAKKRKISNFVVASNRLLAQIANEQPTNIDQLRDLKGIGKTFVSNFGKDVIRTVNNYVQKKNASNSATKAVPGEFQRLVELTSKGYKLSEIALKLKIEIPDAARLVQDALEAGIEMPANLFFHKYEYEAVKSLLMRYQGLSLRRINELLKIKIDYPTLRIIKAFVMRDIKERRF